MKNARLRFSSLLILGMISQYAASQEATATVIAQADAVATPTIAKAGPITVTVELVGGQRISGALAEVSELPFRSSFGEVKVQLVEVAGVKLASADDSSTTIIMKNGDSITGAVDLKVLSVDTEWGNARINGSSVTSILMFPDMKWNASMGLNGKRWSLVDSKGLGQGGGNAGPTGTAATGSPAGSATTTGPRVNSSSPNGPRPNAPATVVPPTNFTTQN